MLVAMLDLRMRPVAQDAAIIAAAGGRIKGKLTLMSSRSVAIRSEEFTALTAPSATTLAFVDGTLTPDGIQFVVTHVKSDGSTLPG